MESVKLRMKKKLKNLDYRKKCNYRNLGKSVQLAAEGYWSILNGANCNYAIKHGEEYSYSITKCKITSNQAKILSNKIN